MKKYFIIRFFFIFFGTLLSTSTVKKSTEHTTFIIQDTFKKDTQFTLQNNQNFTIQVSIKYPKKTNGKTILLLHGFNLPHLEWCQKTTFCEQALDSGYTLVIPNFGKTTYQYKNYPQTIANYKKYPTRRWIVDTFITYMQSHIKLLLNNKKSYVLGLSTGGRGATLLAIDCPKIFAACASLSGDFDQTKLPQEKIYIGYYGNYLKYKKIWENDDNIHAMIKQLTIPIYLSHGKKDNIAPMIQSTNFYKLLIKNKKKVTYDIDTNAKHDYTFWGSCTNKVLLFFRKY